MASLPATPVNALPTTVHLAEAPTPTLPDPVFTVTSEATPHNTHPINAPTQPPTQPPTHTFEVDIEAQRPAPSSTLSTICTRLSDHRKRFRHTISIGSGIIALTIITLEL